MRTVTLQGWPWPVSALGFGTASLGSRVSRKQGIAAVEHALDAGITWFDTAPSYGDGLAEEILGSALAGTKVAIVTKVGLDAAPPSVSRRALGAIARPIVRAVPGLRARAKQFAPPSARRLELDATNIRTSLSRSLERLKVDRVAVLALHEPTEQDLRSEAVMRGLSDVLDQGMATRIAIAGTERDFATARQRGFPIDVAQLASSPFAPVRPHLFYDDAVFPVLHSVLGVGGSLGRLQELLARDPTVRNAMRELGYSEPEALLLAYAFATNPNGVVLMSSFNPPHLRTNQVAAGRTPAPGLAKQIEAMTALKPALLPAASSSHR